MGNRLLTLILSFGLATAGHAGQGAGMPFAAAPAAAGLHLAQTAPSEAGPATPAPAEAKADPACRADTLLLRGGFGRARFSVDVADDGPERARGLMHVKQMPASYGMLFVYPSPRSVSFWMKNTLIPLDMIFADRHGVVQRVHAMAKPGDLSQIPGGEGIQYVLEINGGLAAMLGIEAGSEMRHPTISEAAWPCG